MTPGERQARAARVKEFLAHDDVKAALTEIEQDIISEWRRTPWFWRQRMKWNELRGLERLKQRLANYASQAAR
jgi:hypothetical protein